MYGQLIPVGGGDNIPLVRMDLSVGRRESNDIVLRFSNVSSNHCQLIVDAGYWYVRDNNSRNGIKVNGSRTQYKRLDPGDVVAIAKHKYEISYDPSDLGAAGPPPPEDLPETVFEKSLLERAGLVRGAPEKSRRYNPKDNKAGQLRKNPDRPM